MIIIRIMIIIRMMKLMTKGVKTGQTEGSFKRPAGQGGGREDQQVDHHQYQHSYLCRQRLHLHFSASVYIQDDFFTGTPLKSKSMENLG